jgi:N-sulfoglucosamine sulfohydrolase
MRFIDVTPAGALLLACVFVPDGPCRAAAPDRPNVVLIIADDMARDDCGAYGNPKVRTPHIDRLAREGMRFDRAFVTASSCSPSRSSILTGRYPHNTGAEELHWPLPREQVSFVEKLKAAGYWTAAAGKWHLGDAVKDRFDAVREAGTAGFQLGTGEDARAPMTASGSGAAQGGYDQWIPVLRDRPRDKPFFLWLASLDPHRDYQPGTIREPHRPGDVVVPPYLPDVPEVRKDLALYYDEIGRLDHYIGEVLAELDRQGVAGETLVLFLSDNGRPFPRCKTTLYDSGIGTPLLARWPGRIRRGSRCGRLVSTIDIAPTVLKLAGIEPGPSFQGKEISPLFADPAAKVRDLIFAERNWHDYAARGRAARSERFKYIRNDDNDRPLTPPADAVRSPTFQTMRQLNQTGTLTPVQRACFVSPRPVEELYDIDADPHELVNLAGDPKFTEVLAGMRRALSEWERETGDVRPGALTPDEFDRETGDPLPNRVRPRQKQPVPRDGSPRP